MTEKSTSDLAAERTGVSRRVVVKSAAWSLPVFAAVGVTPAFAASGSVTHSSMIASRQGGNSPTVSFNWTLTVPANATITSVTFGTVEGITFGAPTISGSRVTFAGTIPNGNNVPSFTATVTLSTGASTRFNVTGDNVPKSTTLAVAPAP